MDVVVSREQSSGGVQSACRRQIMDRGSSQRVRTGTKGFRDEVRELINIADDSQCATGSITID
jgi:hypothetical protein